jgi:hypothetical protein
MTKLINLTPHDVTLRLPSGEEMVIPASGQVARVVSDASPVMCEVRGIPVPVALPSAPRLVEGLPPPEEGVAYIVSQVVRAQVPMRNDVYSPGTGPEHGAIRVNGQIVAVTCLVAA